MVEIYQDEDAGDGCVAPVTPSSRHSRSRALGGNSDRKSKKGALTPKDTNRMKRKSFLGGKLDKTSDKASSSAARMGTTTTVSHNASTGTERRNRTESKIVRPRVSLSRVAGASSSAKTNNSSSNTSKTSTTTARSSLRSATLRPTLGGSLGLGKPAARIVVGGGGGNEEDSNSSSCSNKPSASTVAKSKTPWSSASSSPSSSSSLSTVAKESQPPIIATPIHDPAGPKGLNSSSNNRAGRSATSTPPSTGSLRDFIQQRRNQLKLEEGGDDNSDVGGVDSRIGGTAGIGNARRKSVTFKDDVGGGRAVDDAQQQPQQNETSGGILMDLSSTFREESSAGILRKRAAAAPAASASAILARGANTAKKPTNANVVVAPPKPLPVLCLGKFQESLWLDFGDESRNVVGKTRSLSFLLEAPKSSSSASASGYRSVEFERIPFKKGFNLIVEGDDTANQSSGGSVGADAASNANNGSGGDPSSRLVVSGADDEGTVDEHTSPTVFCIKNGDRKRLRLTWTPTEAGGVREAVHLKLPQGRIRITAHGKARAIGNGKKSKKKAPKVTAENYAKGSLSSSQPPPPTTPHRSVRKANKGPTKSVSIVASTPAQPDFSTPKTVFAKSSPASSIMSASKARAQIMYDSDWAEKQCDAFAKWLNYTIQPTEDVAHELSLQVGVDSSDLTRSGLRTLLLHRRRAQGRKKAMELYQSDEMRKIRHAIEAEVDCGKLSIRSDRDVFADVGLRGQIVSLLLSYSTPWLRLGLETIFGEMLSGDISASGSEGKVLRPRAMLKRFIVKRVFSDPILTKKYTGGRHTSTKTLSGRFEKEYKKAMRKHSLRCILLLVAFLDRAKTENILESVPCLFMRKADVKSSKDVITAICRDLLFKEGNIFKHLSKIGLTVVYKQESIDEYIYSIENLAVDLRDGVRFARMAEILTNDASSSLTKQMRLPTVSRLQKLHNMEVALSALVEAGVPNLGDISTHHIVDGHRPRVLKLLWSTIAHFKLPSLLDLNLLQQEIDNVHRANKSRRVFSMRYIGNQDIDRDEAAAEVDRLSVLEGNEAMVGRLLLQWCQAVSSCFGLRVDNFTSSFADGKVLCLLLHYYHPGMLKRSEILPTTRDLPKDVALRKSGERYEKALSNERKNSTLANKRMSELGGVPGMLPITNSCHNPEEKSTLLCLAYLCSRLMESSKEILATIAIQNCYRRYQDRVLLEKKRAAALVILEYWQENKAAYFASQRQKYGPSVRVIEQFLFNNKDKIDVLRARREAKEAQFDAACLLQGAIRRWVAVRKFQGMLVEFSAAKKIQTTFRSFHQRYQYSEMQSTSVTIQSFYRGSRARAHSELARSSAVTIQKSWRGFVAALQFQCNLLNIITVQSCARRRAAMKESKQRKVSVLRLQGLARQKLAVFHVRSLQAHFKAAAIIQGMCRSYKARKDMEVMRSSATKIQAFWRRFQGELQYMNILMDIICVQCYARRFIARQQSWNMWTSIIQIQRVVRMWSSQRRLVALRKDQAEAQRLDAAAIVCQRLARRIVATKRFETLLIANRVSNRAATAIQALYRGAQSRQSLTTRHGKATKIQSAWRRFTTELRYECSLMDIVYAQACTRRLLAILESTRRKASIVKLQCAVRIWIAMRRVRARRTVEVEVNNFVAAVVVCQSVARRRRALKRVNRKRSQVAMLNKSALRIQTIWRGFSADIKYQYAVLAITCIQSIIRRQQACKLALRRGTSVVTLQCIARQWLARRELMRAKQMSEEEKVFHRQCIQSSIGIQSLVRGAQARTLYKMHLAARQIQKTWRGYVQNVDFMVSILSAITIQAGARTLIRRKRFEKTKQAVVSLQALARGSIARASLQQEIAAATRIQSLYRCMQAIDAYQRQQDAVVLMQSAVRGAIIRREVNLEHYAACEIQRVWRGYQANVDYIMMVLAAIQIQSVSRMVAARRMITTYNEDQLAVEVERRYQYAMARKIQRAYRNATIERVLTRKAIIIQRSARAFVIRNRAAKIMRVVLFLQSAFRARSVRLMRTRKACIAAHRIEKANKQAKSEPQMRLGVRTSAALQVLQTSKRLSEVIRAIKTLEVSTRLSEKCCRAFAAANAPVILCALIRTCNRSLPHIELLHYVLLTLSNVARYPYLLDSIATNDLLEVLLDLTQMFRDKENIFCLAIALLQRIVFSNENLLDMCRSSENIKRLKGIYALSKRRQNMARGSMPKGSSVNYDLKRGIHTLEKILRRCKN